jgi:hypothetical protein
MSLSYAIIPTSLVMKSLSYTFASVRVKWSPLPGCVSNLLTRMAAAGVQILAQAIGGQQIPLHAASTTRYFASPYQDPQSRMQGPSQARSSDPKPAVIRERIFKGSDSCHKKGVGPPTIADQQKPSEAPVATKKKKHKSTASVQPDQADEARFPDDELSRVDASSRHRAARAVRACAWCGVTAKASAQGKLKECSSCRSVRYCGAACQKADWPAHKATCKRLLTLQGSTSSCPLSDSSQL